MVSLGELRILEIILASLGDQPSTNTIAVVEIGFGLGQHLGVGFYFFEPDALGNPTKGGIVFHFGLGIGTPMYGVMTLNDASQVRTW